LITKTDNVWFTRLTLNTNQDTRTAPEVSDTLPGTDTDWTV
jgi:hypothetical protein